MIAPGDLVMIVAPPPPIVIEKWDGLRIGSVGVVLSTEYTPAGRHWCNVHDVLIAGKSEVIAICCLRKLQPPPPVEEPVDEELTV